MIENTVSLLPFGVSGENQDQPKGGALVFAHDMASAQELIGLLQTLGIETKEKSVKPIRQIIASTYLGKGLLEALKVRATACEAMILAVDVELSPHQIQKCQEFLEMPVLDRTAIIIEIFSQNAQTKEAKTQVAMARLNYLLPRLSHLWSHFERQQGGKAISRGMGEKQLEVDRRLVKNRLIQLKKQLIGIEQKRKTRRKGRKDFFKVALIGYTNAGKSTLLNALTQAEVLVANKLFATLDASARLLEGSASVIICDTVGFIHKLPPALVASFKSTLEEIFEADLLIHVMDAHHPDVLHHRQVTESILKDLKVDQKPQLVVLNKCDLLKTKKEEQLLKVSFLDALMLSATNPADIKDLKKRILNILDKDLVTVEILVPYHLGKLEAQVYQHAQVEQKRYVTKGIFLKMRIALPWFKKMGLEKFQL